MSRCGWVSKPAPGAKTSRLYTSRRPEWVLAPSWWWPKEKECLESSQSIRVVKRELARRMSTSMIGVVTWDPNRRSRDYIPQYERSCSSRDRRDHRGALDDRRGASRSAGA